MSEPHYVFDTEALIAFLYAEPGHEVVAARLREIEAGGATGAVAETNAAEVLYLVARIEGDDGVPTAASLRAADRDVRSFDRRGVTLARADWRLAAEIKADGSCSLADAYAVALAVDHGATLVVGADDDFDDLPVGVELERFRTEPG